MSEGVCCLSCRAFFRRTVARVKAKGLKECKTGLRRCEVSEVSKTCIHCRYNKCLTVGMNPKLLLTREKSEEREVDVAFIAGQQAQELINRQAPRSAASQRKHTPGFDILSDTDQLMLTTPFYQTLGKHRAGGEMTQPQVS